MKHFPRSDLLLLAALLSISCASVPAQPTPSAPVAKRAFFALSVSDLDQVAGWYVRNLGFKEVLRREPTDGPKAAILHSDGAILELLEFSTARPRTAWGMPDGAHEAHQVHGILKMGFEVADVDELFRTAQQRRLEIFFPLVRPEGSELRTFGLLDPEGNILQFFGR